MIDSATFRSLLGRFASGVTIITARDESGADHGMTVSAFCSVSLVPPQVLICVDQTAEMCDVLQHTEYFGVNILAASQEDISRRFADVDIERFDGLGWERGETGVALLKDTIGSAECRVVTRLVAGDHLVCVGEALHASLHQGQPLLYYRGGYAQLER